MIFVRNVAHGPDGRGLWLQHELRSRELVIVRARYEGCFRDEAFAPESTEGCPAIRYVLDGRIVGRVGEKIVELMPGDGFVSRTYGTPFRSLTTTDDVLHIAWRGGGAAGSAVGGDAQLRPSPSTRMRLARLAELLASTDGRVSSMIGAAFDALVALRDEGVPLTPSSAMEVRPVRESAYEVARAVECAMYPISSQPMSVDLARKLGVGEYHALRRANAHFREFYFSVNGWRDYVKRRRIELGAFFMGRADARTEDVARVLGFRSPTSFCHAFQAAGLPSPRTVQRELLAG